MSQQEIHNPPSDAPPSAPGNPVHSANTGSTAPEEEPAPLDLVAYSLGSTTMKIVPAPAKREWMTATDQRFANRCLPLLIANQNGWLVLNNAGFTAEWSGNDALNSVSVTYDSGNWPLAGSYFGYGILTWSIPFVFRTPPGYNMLVRGPANSPKNAISPLEGIVESDWASSTFTMNWKFTAPFTTVRFEVGEPVCMIVPQRREELETFQPRIRTMDSDPELRDRHNAWAQSRKDFLDRHSDGWQKDYFQGKHATGEASEQTHQTRLHLSEFEVDLE